MTTRTIALSTFAATLALLTLSSAHAAETPTSTGARSHVVEYGELNLASARGAQSLYRRIESAARIVCEHPGARLAASQSRSRQCMAAAIERAVTDVNAPGLTVYYAERNIRRAQSPTVAVRD